jgi:MFS family permease
MGVFTLNLLDRGVMGLLMQPIKEDLHLSDTQLGFLTGIAFALFYATFGVPIARWADRGNRVTITSAAIALWGLTVMSCLFVTNYSQLLIARMAAAVGESGCKPPTYSLVGDYFPEPAERIRAMSFYWLSGPLATLISPVAGGWLCTIYGWRMTFFLIGIPGVLLALIVKFTLIEPRTRSQDLSKHEATALPPMKEVLGMLWHRRSCRHLVIALVLLFSMGFGIDTWSAAYLMRSHGMGIREVGVGLGAAYGLGAGGGVLLGGYVASRWFGGDERSQMRISAIALLLAAPCYVAFLLFPQKYSALIMLTLVMLAMTFFAAPTYTLMQRLVPDETRATTMSVIMLTYNLIGMGVAPQVVGFLSDRLAPFVGADSLRYAMLSMTFVGLWSAYHFWQAGRTIREDLSLVLIRRLPLTTRAAFNEVL